MPDGGKVRVLAVTPTYGQGFRPETRASMEALDLEGIELDWRVIDENPYPAPDHRNVGHMYHIGQRMALDGGYDVMWTVEHDMVLPPDAARKLAATPGDVAYGVYLFRWGTFVLNAFEYLNDRNIGESFSLHPKKAEAARKAGVVRVSGAGWGCTWIRRKGLEKVEILENHEENPAFDVAFAKRAIQAHLAMYANFEVLCGHLRGRDVLIPFEHPRTIEYDGGAFMIGGQLMPRYRTLKAQPVHVRARQTLNAQVDGKSRRLVAGEEYDLPSGAALDLLRAGYVLLVTPPSPEDGRVARSEEMAYGIP